MLKDNARNRLILFDRCLVLDFSYIFFDMIIVTEVLSDEVWRNSLS